MIVIITLLGSKNMVSTRNLNSNNGSLKQLGRSASPNHTIIYIAAEPSHVDVDHVAHACNYIVRPQCLFSKAWRAMS